MKYNNDRNLFKIILDSGNDLSLPAISAVMYKKLKDSKIIPDKLSLKRTSCSIKGADNSPLSVLGKLNYPLIFTHPSNHNLELKFNQFYVIEGLSNSINLGKPVLKQIDTVWDFKSPTISIKNISIPLTNQKEEGNPGNINKIIKSEPIDQKIRLYAKSTSYIPPRSAMIIQLKSSPDDKLKLTEDVLIIPDQHFQNSRKVFIMPESISNKNHLLTTITNPYDSGITIKKGQVLAYANEPDKTH